MQEVAHFVVYMKLNMVINVGLWVAQIPRLLKHRLVILENIWQLGNRVLSKGVEYHLLVCEEPLIDLLINKSGRLVQLEIPSHMMRNKSELINAKPILHQIGFTVLKLSVHLVV